MERFDRIYRLHGILANRRTPISLQAIMEQLECSKATVERCIRDMRIRFDAPLFYDRYRNGYYYDQESAGQAFQLPGIWFSAEELQGLLICNLILKNISAGYFSAQISKLQQRIEKILTREHLPQADIAGKFQLLSPGRRLKDDILFKKTATAVFAGQQLCIVYRARGRDGTQSERTISPQRLIYYRENWYLAAWCHQRQDMRLFAVDNIISAETLQQTAVSVDTRQLEQFLNSSYGIFTGEARHQAILQFSSARAKWVADENWHPQQQSRWLDDGSYELTLPFRDSRELIMDILKHGAEVEVIAPAFLRQAVLEQITAMQKIYKK